jgi:hypothetical protein
MSSSLHGMIGGRAIHLFMVATEAGERQGK